MTIHDLLKVAVKKLKNSTSPELDGEVLLSHVLDQPKEFLYANPKHKLPPAQTKQFKILLERRTNAEPVAYLTKKKEFFGLEFYVDKNVLVPRPETEGLVELVLDNIKGQKNLNILEVGTGSGCIIISLAKNLNNPSVRRKSADISPERGEKNYPPLSGEGGRRPGGVIYKFFASDISSQAIKIAKKNAKIHRVKITFGDGSLLEPWKGFKFDTIVANLPYLVRESDPSTKFEPKGALIAAKKGLALYEKLFKQIPSLSTQPSSLFLEIGRDQGGLIKKLAKKYLPAYKTTVYKDLFGRTRYAILAKASQA